MIMGRPPGRRVVTDTQSGPKDRETDMGQNRYERYWAAQDAAAEHAMHTSTPGASCAPTCPSYSGPEQPVYAWTVEGQISTGSLANWTNDYVNSYYSGLDVSTMVTRLIAGPDGVAAVRLPVAVQPMGGYTTDNFLHYRASVTDDLTGAIDTADFSIDGRA